MKLLITGGAGYIGSHLAHGANAAGHEVVVFDNLSSGCSKLLKWGDFVEGDLLCQDSLTQLFAGHSFDAVLHLAAFVEVEDSVRNPLSCYATNLRGSHNLIEAALSAGVSRMVFSSTAAVYGDCDDAVPISEQCLPAPKNPYAASKLAVEQMLESLETAGLMQSVRLRFFNVAGAHPDGDLGHAAAEPTHLIPLLLRAASSENDCFAIYGDNYPTADGTCVRDFVHVQDIADAHLAALDRLMDGSQGGCFNLGTGCGHSVRQVLDAVSGITGATIECKTEGPRPGDSAFLVADSSLAANILDWRLNYPKLEQIINHAWQWHLSDARREIMEIQ